MRLICKIFSSNINFRRYLFLFTLLLLFFWLMSSLNITISNIIFKKNNAVDNRKVSIILNEGMEISKLEKVEYIKKIKKLESEEYEIIFEDYRDVELFTNEFSEYYSIITFYGDSSENENVLLYLNSIFSINSYIVLGVLSIVLVIGIVESFLEFISDISLFKLLGFSNILIIKLILMFFVFSFSCLFCISALIFRLLVLIINILFEYFSFNFVLYTSNIQFTIMLYSILVIFILLIVSSLYLKLKKITPISFVKNNLSL